MWKRWVWVAALLALGAAACSGGAAVQEAGGETTAGTAEPPAAAEEPPTDAGSVGIANGGQDGGDLPAVPAAAVGERIIKEGTIAIEVDEGGFDAAFNEIVVIAQERGGAVINVSSVSDRDQEDGGTSGSVTVRVPVDEYESLLASVTGIGTVVERRISSRDVTTEFVDLESRLNHLEAEEVFYLELLEQAEDVQDAIAVQQQLSGLQSEIERITGRLQLLEDRTSFSRLTVELFEPDTPISHGETPQRPSLARYWETARDAFINVIGLMLVAGTFLTPLVAPALLAFLLYRVWRRHEAPTPVD